MKIWEQLSWDYGHIFVKTFFTIKSIIIWTAFCNQINRTGQLCGKRSKRYAPAVYSYGSLCVQCTHYIHNWIKYLVIAYLPVAILYVLVILFQLNAMSPSVIAYIFVSQIVSSPAFASIFITFVYSAEKHPIVRIKLRLIGDLIRLDYAIAIYIPCYLFL